MSPPEPSPASSEGVILAALDRGDHDAAVTEALRLYGAEVYSFLAALHLDATTADDAYALFCEGVWRGLPRFARSSSVRTWAYAIARRCSLRARRDRRRAEARAAPLPDSSGAAAIAASVRTATASWLATRTRTRLEELRATLPDDDQTLLMLRLDRGLPWDELARVLSDEELDEQAVKRVAARLRKRFQLVKDRLVALGRAEGLLP